MVKTFCDICEEQIMPTDLMAEFASVERSYIKNQPPQVKRTALCEKCADKIRHQLAELLVEKK